MKRKKNSSSLCKCLEKAVGHGRAGRAEKTCLFSSAFHPTAKHYLFQMPYIRLPTAASVDNRNSLSTGAVRLKFIEQDKHRTEKLKFSYHCAVSWVLPTAER